MSIAKIINMKNIELSCKIKSGDIVIGVYTFAINNVFLGVELRDEEGITFSYTPNYDDIDKILTRWIFFAALSSKFSQKIVQLLILEFTKWSKGFSQSTFYLPIAFEFCDMTDLKTEISAFRGKKRKRKTSHMHAEQ